MSAKGEIILLAIEEDIPIEYLDILVEDIREAFKERVRLLKKCIETTKQ